LEQAEEMARHMNRSDSLNAALSLIEDVDEEVLGGRDRWAMAAAIAAAHDAASEEAIRYRTELGL
jgi:hypothetical protein